MMSTRYLDLPCRDLDEVLRERTAITADEPDAFEAGGRQDGDAAILALFAKCRAAKTEEVYRLRFLGHQIEAYAAAAAV
jgi:hypothetical protein